MSQKYYIFDFACNTKETGPIFPQIQGMSKGYDYKGEKSIRKLSRHWQSFPSFIPDLNSFILEKRARLTDVISNSLSSTGLIVSSKVRNIFLSLETCPIQFYPTSIIHNDNIIEDFYWMHIISDYSDYVDYSNSSFFIYQNFNLNLGDISIVSKTDYAEKEIKLKQDNQQHTLAIWAKHIKMLPAFSTNLDFFAIGKFDKALYSSERLIQKLQKEEVTGFTFHMANNLSF